LIPAPKNRPILCEVKSITRHTDDTKTLKIRCPNYLCSKSIPGQFLMVWIPGIDEIPMSISSVREEEIWITVKRVGQATSAIHDLNEGEELGLRGPYGNGFTIGGSNILIAAGGIGAAPLLFLARRLRLTKNKITLILGAKTSEKVVLENEFDEVFFDRRSVKRIVCTDDGSKGAKGYVSEIAGDLIRKESFDRVYTCGPEPMMCKVINNALASRIQVEASLERYMRCGIGLCGSCHIGKYLVCKDGPVFSNESLVEVVKYLKP
jgi:dihydroorotate dehydrogenase electron transfer subunit